MKNKHILITLLIGIIFVTLGSLFKITHQPVFGLSANSLLSTGLLIELIAVIMLFFKLIKDKKIKKTLNS